MKTKPFLIRIMMHYNPARIRNNGTVIHSTFKEHLGNVMKRKGAKNMIKNI